MTSGDTEASKTYSEQLRMLEIILKEAMPQIKEDEGYRTEPYKCTEGYLTIGWGSRIDRITEDEAEWLFKHRLTKMVSMAFYGYPDDNIDVESFVYDLPLGAQVILANMTYQLGVGGILKFKKMWAALEKRDYEQAAVEMLDSVWAKQTKARAERLAEAMRNVGVEE